jgi:hypothetical protein
VVSPTRTADWPTSILTSTRYLPGGNWASLSCAVGTLTSRSLSGSTVTLVVVASDDLRSGLDVIPATQMRWTTSGTGFVSGTMSKTAAQTVASWVNSGAWTGTQSYTLTNAWTYATGTYSATLTYTLTAP